MYYIYIYIFIYIYIYIYINPVFRFYYFHDQHWYNLQMMMMMMADFQMMEPLVNIKEFHSLGIRRDLTQKKSLDEPISSRTYLTYFIKDSKSFI